MTANQFAVFALVSTLTTVGLANDDAEPEKRMQIGTVTVDDYTGLVLFQDPADGGKSYRITLAIPKPSKIPGIKRDRIEVWLLARAGKALVINKQPKGDVLVEFGSAGATANAIFFFDRSVEAGDLRTVVVAVDGQPKAFKLVPSE